MCHVSYVVCTDVELPSGTACDWVSGRCEEEGERRGGGRETEDGFGWSATSILSVGAKDPTPSVTSCMVRLTFSRSWSAFFNCELTF